MLVLSLWLLCWQSSPSCGRRRSLPPRFYLPILRSVASRVDHLRSVLQRSLQAQALKTSIDIGQTRWLLFAQRGSSIPLPFLVVLVFWLTILFASFSLFAPPNATVVITLLVCALSVSGAIFLILELDRPFDGLIQIPSAPLRSALAQLGK